MRTVSFYMSSDTSHSNTLREIEINLLNTEHEIVENMKKEHIKMKTIRKKNVTHICNYHDDFIICGKFCPLFVNKKTTRKLEFLKHYHVLGIDSDVIWAVFENQLHAFDYDGILIIKENLPSDSYSITSSKCLAQAIYICSETQVFYYDISNKCSKVIEGIFDSIDISRYSDIMVYGNSLCYISNCGQIPNTSKHSFRYNNKTLISMKWADIYICKLDKKSVHLLDNEGNIMKSHMLHSSSCSSFDLSTVNSYIHCSTSSDWLACMDATNTVTVFNIQLQPIYEISNRISNSNFNQRYFAIGSVDVCIADNERINIFHAEPSACQFKWVSEVNKWARGLQGSLRSCIMIDYNICKKYIIENLPLWLKNNPSLLSCSDLKLMSKRSIEITKGFIESTHDWVKVNIDVTSRDFWRNLFSIIRSVLSGGLPEVIKVTLAESKRIYALAECCYVFGVDMFMSSDMITWIIVNQTVPMYREILYEFIASEKCGDMVVDVITATAASASNDTIYNGNNPFFLLSCKDILGSCKRGNISAWLTIFEKHSTRDVTLHMQNIFDNITEMVVFGSDINEMLMCLFLCEPPSRFSMAPTIRVTMIRHIYEVLPKEYKKIHKDKISRCLQVLDFKLLKLENTSFKNDPVLSSVSNDCGNYVSTTRGVFSVPYIGIMNSATKILLPFPALALAARVNMLGVSYIGDMKNFVSIFNTTTDSVIFQWETDTPVVGMDFIQDVLFTVQKSDSIIIFNYMTGRREDYLRSVGTQTQNRMRSLSEDSDGGIPVIPLPIHEHMRSDESPIPPLDSEDDGEREDDNEEDEEIEEIIERLPSPPPIHPLVQNFFDSWKSLDRSKTRVVVCNDDIVLENKGQKTILWKKRGLSFSSKYYDSPDSHMTLCVTEKDENLFYNAMIFISKYGNIRVTGRTEVFSNYRQELITSAVLWGSHYIIMGSVKGTIVLFNLVKMKEVYVFHNDRIGFINHLYVDGILLNVSTNEGIHVVSMLPWKQERVIETLTSIGNTSPSWLRKISSFPYDLNQIHPNRQFIQFIEMCTRFGNINVSFKSNYILNMLLNMHKKCGPVVLICLRRLVTETKPKEPLFKCAICQSSAVDEDKKNLSVVTTCLHRFHTQCVNNLIESIPDLNVFTRTNWALNSSLKCPVCRTPFTKNDCKLDPFSTKQCIYSSDDSDNEEHAKK